MNHLSYCWEENGGSHEMRLVAVGGTGSGTYLFGAEGDQVPVNVNDFYVMTTPVTQALWVHVIGANPTGRNEPRHPVYEVSWNDIRRAGGFIDRLNSGPVLGTLSESVPGMRFRLPSESEWEYAARGGPHWEDGFEFSGGDRPAEVAWFGRTFGPIRRFVFGALGWPVGWRLATRFSRPISTHPHEVETKAPNQLGIYDMSGNVWEWCEDGCVHERSAVPRDGRPWVGTGDSRRLRGGCHHNWDIHCTVSFRYGIEASAHDGCIGFRLVLAPDTYEDREKSTVR